MKCIMCGKDVTLIYEDVRVNNEFGQYDSTIRDVTRFKCIPCGLEWTLPEHKDNQDWAVRHIRLLEQENKLLNEKIEILLQKLGV